jgi:hypothetical protein
MPRRCGPNCSPRSGAALSISTGLCSSGVASRVMLVMATASVSSFFICAVAAVLVAIFIRHNLAAVSTGVVEDTTWTSEPLHGPTSTVSCWLGFAFNSTLGYPGEGPPTCLELDEGTELWLQELETTKRLIEELPVVRDVTFFYHEDDPNLNYIQATLWCCWSGGRLKRLKEATDQTGKKPTHLEAAKALHDTIVKKHACEGRPDSECSHPSWTPHCALRDTTREPVALRMGAHTVMARTALRCPVAAAHGRMRPHTVLGYVCGQCVRPLALSCVVLHVLVTARVHVSWAACPRVRGRVESRGCCSFGEQRHHVRRRVGSFGPCVLTHAGPTLHAFR